MLVQQPLRLVASHILAHGDDLARHQIGDRLAGFGGEPDVAIGDDADQLAVAALHHRDAGDAVVGHQLQRVGQRLVGMDGDRIHHHAGFELLDLADFVGLLGDGHVAMDDAETAGLRHCDRERAFRHRIHRRRDQRNAELDLAGQARFGLGLGGQDPGGGGNEKNVVEGESLTEFH